MNLRFHVSEIDGTFDYGKWVSGHVYSFQELLELCFKRQEYIDHWKKLTGLKHSPWVVIPRFRSLR